jgi:hypothetical protein
MLLEQNRTDRNGMFIQLPRISRAFSETISINSVIATLERAFSYRDIPEKTGQL